MINDKTKDYVFISYSHKDQIEPYIKFLSDSGYNLLYDTSLSFGEDWDIVVRSNLKNQHCKGVISFISCNALTSKAILKETDYIRQFNKKNFAICLKDVSIQELYYSIENELDKAIAEEIMECFPPEKLFLFAKEFKDKFDQIRQTFDAWEFYPCLDDYSQNAEFQRYSTDNQGEKERLIMQGNGYYDFDKKNIRKVLDTFERNDLIVLDIGCSNGAITYSRFHDELKVAKVIGIDINKKDIEYAKRLEYGKKFSFYCLDVESDDMQMRIKDIMEENGVRSIDIVFSALVLHHLREPNKLLLRLYDLFQGNGMIILRGSDDGSKMCYPHGELMCDLNNRYGTLFGSVNDRFNGRKLFNMLYHAGYMNIAMDYQVFDTCDRSVEEKALSFKVSFSHRVSRLKVLAEKNPENKTLLNEIKWQLDALQVLEKDFSTPDFWYSNTSYIAIAEVFS